MIVITKINIKDYVEFEDIYYGLLSFISRYVNQNFNPFEGLDIDGNQNSKYALAIEIMKKSLKEALDYFKTVDYVYLPSLKRNINVKPINIEEQLALEERCKEYMIFRLNEEFSELNLKGGYRL